MQDIALADYMLTGNRSMFLSIDGTVAWLHQSPSSLSPPRVLDTCHDPFPIL